MPPKGKSAVKPAVDSSDEDLEQKIGELRVVRHERQQKATFSVQAIYQAVMGAEAHSVRTHVPSFCASAEVAEDWAAWREETAEKLSQLSAEKRALPLRMPMKCVPHTATQPDAGVQATAEQVDLITYQNPGGGGGLSKDARNYEAKQVTAILEGMTDVDDVVIINRPEQDEGDIDGFRTPFYLGRVLQVHFEEGGAGGSSTQEKRTIVGIDVHWHYPFFNGTPCDDVKRPWKAACQGLLHEWEKACDKRLKCVHARRPELGVTWGSREWSYVKAAAIHEMGLQMTPKTFALSASSKEKLSANKEWAELLQTGKGERKERKRKL